MTQRPCLSRPHELATCAGRCVTLVLDAGGTAWGTVRARLTSRCDSCRRTAADIAAAHRAGAESAKIDAGLQLCWWFPRDSGWREAHYCDDCAPSGTIWPVECAICLDGPLIVLAEHALPGMPLHPTERRAAQAHLRWLGWQEGRDGTFICPDCRPSVEASTTTPPRQGWPETHDKTDRDSPQRRRVRRAVLGGCRYGSRRTLASVNRLAPGRASVSRPPGEPLDG